MGVVELVKPANTGVREVKLDTNMARELELDCSKYWNNSTVTNDSEQYIKAAIAAYDTSYLLRSIP